MFLNSSSPKRAPADPRGPGNPADSSELASLLTEIRGCRVCVAHLPNPPKPVLRADPSAKILIVGQAPGRRVQASGIPWDDPSGVRLREWLGLTPAQFYDEQTIAILPTGFCYPGKGTSGDLPPRPECAPLWHPRLLPALPALRLTLLIGRYAQAYYLGGRARRGLTETVAAYADYLPEFFPLPHPSPRNVAWFKCNSWFQHDALPALRRRVATTLA